MNLLIPSFPRDVAFPERKYCETEDEFYSLINRYNNYKDVFFDLYRCNLMVNDGEKRREFYGIDKLFFDFDIDKSKDQKEEFKNVLSDVLRFSTGLIDEDLLHLICFSGSKGFHVYVFCDEYTSQNQKETLYNAQTHFADKYHLLKADFHVIGDDARISRVPNTKHIGSKKYCIPITRDDLEKGISHIFNKATIQQFNFTYYGKNKLSLNKFEYKTNRFNGNGKMKEFDYKIEVNDKMIERFLPCVQTWLTEKKMGTYKARYFFSIYCREMCLPKETCNMIAKKYFSKMPRTDNLKNNYRHMVKHKVISYAYRKDTFFPSCKELYKQGLCKGKCDKCDTLYKKCQF